MDWYLDRRELVGDLRPPIVDELNLVEAIQYLVNVALVFI